MAFSGNIPVLFLRIKVFSMFLVLSLIIFIACDSPPNKEYIGLEGEWQFRIDSLDVGVSEKWYLEGMDEEVRLPGSMKENGKGFNPSLITPWTGSIYDSSWYFNPKLTKYRTGDTLRFPFWLTPRKHYVGPAWYRKTIMIPANWEGKRVMLHLERPHWESTVWIDSTLVSNQNSLSVPHEMDITPYLHPGEHILTIRIDNRLDEVNVGPDSHSVSDHTQGNWNGIIGDMYLAAGPMIHMESIQLYPDLENHSVKAIIRIADPNAYQGPAELEIFAKSLSPAPGHRTKHVHNTINLEALTDTIGMILPMGRSYNTWDEFQPHLYSFTAVLNVQGVKSSETVQFGMRNIRTEKKQILVNGNPVFMRGTVNCCEFPLTGYPAMDPDSWLDLFKVLKSYGLNHVRFHSWCPPEAAFDAADQIGMYLQPEGPTWPNHGTSLGNGRSIDRYIYEESERIMEQYGNHPSFCMFASGNEPRGNYVAFLEQYLAYWKDKDSRRIYTGASIGGSWRECAANEFQVKGGARGLPWKRLPNSTFTFEKNIARFNTPFITHELGQYCVFPDFSEISEYTGSFRAYNFELFRDLLDQNHMGDQAALFLSASGELQKRCYKYEMEAMIRTHGMTGYQLLGINDFPGQGTALVGVLNAFYEPKGYASSEYFRQFCGPVTLLATLPKFIWTTGEEFTAGIEVANYGPETIRDAKLFWQIIDEKHTILASGEKGISDIPQGEVREQIKVKYQPAKVQQAMKVTLQAKMEGISNSWDFWLFPEELPTLNISIHITDTLDAESEKILREGGKVLLLASGKVENGKDVVQYFTPVFWNTSWFKMRPPHTTGVLIQDEHPVFDHFPTSYHSDLQWWEILNRQQVMNLENFPSDFRPLVQPIDTWFLSRRLGLLWEAKTNGGKLMVCSADLSSEPEQRPAARQLLHSIISYMESDNFLPEDEVALPVVHELFESKERQVVHLYTRNSPDELKPKH